MMLAFLSKNQKLAYDNIGSESDILLIKATRMSGELMKQECLLYLLAKRFIKRKEHNYYVGSKANTYNNCWCC